MSYKKLKRSNTNSVIAGVCGGLGEYFDIDPIIFRIIFVVLFFAGGGGGIIYLILWIFIPRDTVYYQPGPDKKEDKDSGPKYDKCADTDIPYEEVNSEKQNPQNKKDKNDSTAGALIAGVVLILIGCMFMMQKFWDINIMRDWWPLILVVAGIIFLFNAINNKSK
ncbi:MAG: PspC domain-containing protein [Bacteroidales bacterium]|jgi:phage shock protein PspC (stress-responsive transcriptional regulator)|nr:PspC domain-containing protein [Bacteroidales bacterium]